MLVSMIFGIIYFAGAMYEDIHAFPAKLSFPSEIMETASFTAIAEDDLSIWLKLSDRQIENKDFTLQVLFLEEKGKTIADINKNFRFGYIRNSSGRGQYYKLSNHNFKNDFTGFLSYKTSGTWIPPYDGLLVIRRQNSIPLPLKHIGIFVAGFFILITGIGSIAKNKKHNNTYNQV